MKNSSTSKKFQTQNGRVINGSVTLKKNLDTKTIKKRLTNNYC